MKKFGKLGLGAAVVCFFCLLFMVTRGDRTSVHIVLKLLRSKLFYILLSFIS